MLGCLGFFGRTVISLVLLGILLYNMNMDGSIAFRIFIISVIVIVWLSAWFSKRNNNTPSYTPSHTSNREKGIRMASLVTDGESCETCAYNNDGPHGMCSFVASGKPVVGGKNICWKHVRKY